MITIMNGTVTMMDDTDDPKMKRNAPSASNN
jgi:hypothetical protein